MPCPYPEHTQKGITFMFQLDRKLGPDEFITTFFEANRQDHQRPQVRRRRGDNAFLLLAREPAIAPVVLPFKLDY